MQISSDFFPAIYQRPWRRALNAIGKAARDEIVPACLSITMAASAATAAVVKHSIPPDSQYLANVIVGLSLLLTVAFAAPVIDEARKYYLSASRLQDPAF